jgi:diaminohydroxyphosphoribosylaminopyrimidine deaminase/5-amino-6-(5-phosphoribosylamino)uracil reductase
VHLKLGQTLDGKVATKSGESKYITSKEAREYVHELRQKYDVIMVGKNTLINDDPSLTVRLDEIHPKHPLRVVIIDLASIDFNLKVFSDEFKRNTMVVTTDADLNKHRDIAFKLENLGIGILALEEVDGRVNLSSLMNTLYSLKLNSILLEGGPTLASNFLKNNMVDKVSIITAPYILGDGVSTLTDIGVSELKNKLELSNLIYKQLGQDFLAEGYLCSPV